MRSPERKLTVPGSFEFEKAAREYLNHPPGVQGMFNIVSVAHQQSQVLDRRIRSVFVSAKFMFVPRLTKPAL